jgi:glycosyltransferase involved in cell wall biosynthesis
MEASTTFLPDAQSRETTARPTADVATSRPAESNLRVAVVVNQIPPYYVRLFQELSETPGWDLKVFTFVDREVDRLWEVREHFTFATHRCFSLSYVRRIRHRGDQQFDDARQIHLPLGLIWDLIRFRPDIVLSGELGGRTVISALYARLFRRRLMVCFEGTRHTERDISRAQRWVRRLIRRAVDAYIVNGRLGRDYLEDLGIPSESIFETGQVVDTQTFAKRLSAEERAVLRDELGIRGHCYLFCGSLNQRKGSDKLLEAWREFSREASDGATLILVGEGSERAALEQRVADGHLMNVRFLGHVQRDKLPAIYQAADVFVLPTLEDCWALVVNEAMASGLPVINSKYAGSSELIVEGETGWVMDPLDRHDMLAKLRLAWEARDQRRAMGEAARETIAQFSVPAVAQRMRRVFDHLRLTRRR